MKTKLTLVIIFSIFFSRAYTQWPAIPSPNVSITSQAATTDASRYWACKDGIGGSYVVWEDDRNDPGNNTGIFCQRMQNFGVVKFVANGVTISDVVGSTQKRPWASEGTNSSALIVWEDERNAGTTLDDIYAKAIDSTGVTLWGGVNGVVICNAVDKQERPQIVTDGAGGGIIVWRDKRNNGVSRRDIYAQRINSAGVVQWTINGVVICNAIDKQSSFHLIADGSGGAIIVWEDDRSGSTTDIYAQKVNSAGVVQWTANGVAICTNTADNQLSPQAVTDGAGGAIIAWEDLRTGGTEDVYAQGISSAGVVQWAVDGIIICNAPDVQARPIITTDGAGGGVITWEDDRSAVTGTGTGRDIYAQRVNGAGIVQWVANGVAVCVALGKQKRAHSSTANGNVLVSWQDARTGTEDIYVEIISPTGAMNSGTIDGVLICNNAFVQKRPFIFDNGSGEWIVVWEDERNNPGGNKDLYSQGLNKTILAALPIELISFNAIPNGNIVELDWATNSEINNDYFTIERSHNGIDWEQVITVSGAGNSSSIVEYFDTDSDPLRGLSYYRLVQTDFDGKTSTSNIVPIEFISNENGTSISVYPNPARRDDNVNVNLSGFEGSEILVVLRDIQGKEVYSKVSLIENSNQIIAVDKTHTLSPGTYLVLASAKNEWYSKKLIITE